jgi:hypothetical protein
MNPVLIKGHVAAAAVEGYRIVRHASGGRVETATGSTDKLVGVADQRGANVGYTLDVVRLGIGLVLLGGTVTAGAEITSNATGCGVALTAAGESVGRADRDGVAGDIIPVFIRPAKLTP